MEPTFHIHNPPPASGTVVEPAERADSREMRASGGKGGKPERLVVERGDHGAAITTVSQWRPIRVNRLLCRPSPRTFEM
jgi:hypothetical protein